MEAKREACWRKCRSYGQTDAEKKLYYKENVLCSFVRRMQHGRKTPWTQRKLTHPDKYFYILYILLLYILRLYVVLGDDLFV